MEISKIQDFLDELYIKHTLHTHVVSESTSQFSSFANSIGSCAIKVVLFSDKRGPVLVMFPANDGLDFDALAKATGRQLKLDSGRQYKKQLCGFSIRNLPPFGRLFQIKMVVDERVKGYDSYLMDIDQGDSFIEVNRKGLDIIIRGASVRQFSQKVPDSIMLSAASTDDDKGKMSTLLTLKVIESMFANGQSLPAMPGVGNQLIQLKGRSDFDFEDLVHLIEADPILSAKILSYASSSFFAYQGKLASVQEAIYHVLGIDLSLNISLALAVGDQFQGPMKGLVGASSIWQQSVYCAVLSQAIASKIKGQPDLVSGTAYLHGLLHNVGFLALGHMFPKKVKAFNKAIEAKPDIALDVLEKNVLGVTHTEVGRLLLEHWEMPDAYKTVVVNHHNSDYRGPHETYTHIVYIANALLKSINIGDAANDFLPPKLLAKYDLTEDQLKDMLQVVLQWNESIDHLAQQLAA